MTDGDHLSAALLDGTEVADLDAFLVEYLAAEKDL